MSKKIQEKKAKKPRPERVTLASLNRKVDMLDSRLRTLKAWETMQDAMEESRSAPAEEWTPKAGDLVVVSRMAERHFPENVGKVMTIGSYNRELEWANIDGVNWHVNNLHPATSAEIASHKAKEEQRAKEDERAKERAKPLEMGTPIRLKIPTHVQGIYLKPYKGAHLVYFKNDDASSMLGRHEFTIID